MSQAANALATNAGVDEIATDGDVLLFLKRTLRFHSVDAGKEDVFEKLQNLKTALDLQAATLQSYPDSPGKQRIHDSLAKAKALVEQTVEEFGAAAQKTAVVPDADTA
jgi:hypothetical protein